MSKMVSTNGNFCGCSWADLGPCFDISTCILEDLQADIAQLRLLERAQIGLSSACFLLQVHPAQNA
eukprot:4043217-Amphidinium_carterae.1